MKTLIRGLLISVFSVACGFFGSTDYVIVRWPVGGLPIYDGANPSFWEVRWLNSSGTVSKRLVSSSQGPLVLELPRESPLIVMATPVTVEYPSPYRVRPAGAVAGADSPLPKNLQLGWEDGFSAQLLLSLIDAEVPPRAINHRRFAKSARERSGNRPWHLNERKLRSDIAGGKLRIHSFRLLKDFIIKAALPEGIWYSQFPLDPPLVSSRSGWEGVLPIGIWHFAHPASSKTATISVDSRGKALLQIEG